MHIAIIDTGTANLNSVAQALRRLGEEPFISSDPAELDRADRLILPGVGSAAPAMQLLRERGLDTYIPKLTRPLLGICLGMQLLAAASTEVPKDSDTMAVATLGIVSGRVLRLKAEGLRLPHLGWNTVSHNGSALFDGIRNGSYFYFDHSFALELGPSSAGITSYGEEFTSVLVSGNFAGTQFHPEKSGAAGSRLLDNFLHRFNPL